MANYSLDAGDPVFANRRRLAYQNPNTGIVPPNMQVGPAANANALAMSTGGNDPAQPVVYPPMSTPLPPTPYPQTTMFPSTQLPPQQVPVMNTGGNQPPILAPNGNTGIVPPNMNTGGNLPPLSQTALSLPALNGQQYVATQQNGTGPNMGADQTVQNTLANLLDRNNPYIARARQAAMDQAGQRGLMNSSIAAGNAEGAAIDAVLPFVQQSLGIQQQREQNAFTGNENLLSRTQGVNNALLAGELQQRQTAYDYNFRNQLQSNQVMQQDWLNNNEFSRNFNATLSLLPVNNAFDMAKTIQAYAAENPEVYTPTVISGMTNFFNQNMLAIMQQYFPDMFQTGGTP
jgi:hypothetical protein